MNCIENTSLTVAFSTELLGDIFEKRLGSFYAFDGKQMVSVKGNIGISNGLTWNQKTKKFYYVDSCDIDVKEYDYNLETGKLSEVFEKC